MANNVDAGSSMVTPSLLLHSLPPDDVMDAFLDEYFSSVHWFSLVVYGPRFRTALERVRSGNSRSSQRPFLLLLSIVLGLGAWYRGQHTQANNGPSPEQSRAWSKKLVENVETQIIKLLDQSSVVAVQTVILLGSFFVYHGRPNLSFSLLGATVKIAHAAGLHKRPLNVSYDEMEERKRVWWTLYTWDRFASITYGRPVSIDDKDCNLPMPEDVSENIDFSRTAEKGSTSVCFSTYQRELNRIYLIASPAIKKMYSAPETLQNAHAGDYFMLAESVTQRLCDWHRMLPDHLTLSLEDDCPTTMTPEAKAHCLQALSLQLTLDSLLIILHRPFLKRHLSILQSHGLAGDHGLGVSSLDTNDSNGPVFSTRASSEETHPMMSSSSRQQWWDAATRTSRVTELPQLTQFATDSHLVAFLAINLFNAAIVMVVISLSDPLMDRTQEAKRAIARIYRLQETLGERSTLSKQSTRILRSLVHLLLRRESDVILAPLVSRQDDSGTTSSTSTAWQSRIPPLSVRDTLAAPLGTRWTQENTADGSGWQHATTMPLDDSLAFVQRAIAVPQVPRLTSFPSLSQPPAEFQQSPSSNTHGISSMDWSTIAAESRDVDLAADGSDWSIGEADAGDGLYWFWDPSWDHLDGNTLPS
nr:hypothetical protein B0A51_11821 [Rachicladosporium sp. CCFEE 5018]